MRKWWRLLVDLGFLIIYLYYRTLLSHDREFVVFTTIKNSVFFFCLISLPSFFSLFGPEVSHAVHRHSRDLWKLNPVKIEGIRDWCCSCCIFAWHDIRRARTTFIILAIGLVIAFRVLSVIHMSLHPDCEFITRLVLILKRFRFMRRSIISRFQRGALVT